MKRARQRRGLVVLVVLLLGLSLAAPAAAGLPEGTTSGGSVGDTLTDSSSDDSTDDSSDDSNGDTSDGSDSGPDSSSEDDPSSDGSSGSDSGSDALLRSTSEDGPSDAVPVLRRSDDGSSGSDSGSDLGPDVSGDGSWESGALDGVVTRTGSSGSDEAGLPTPLATVVDGTPEATADSVSDADLVDVDAPTSSTSYRVELVELDGTDEALVELTTTAGTTTEAVTAVGAFGDSVSTTDDRLTAGTSPGTSASTDAARLEAAGTDPTSPADGGTASVEPRDSAATGADAASGRNALGVSVSSDDLPGGPAGAGAVVGLVGAAAAIVARQSGALSGLSGNLWTTARTASAPMAESRYLDRLVRMLAPFRYSRYDDSDPLEHEARDAMFEVVEQSPGTYLSEIADRADLPLSTARHHIRVLEREDLVTGAKVRGKRRFYPAHTEGVELAAAMNDDSTAAVIDALARLGAASVSDLADELEKDPSTVTHHVQRLEEDEVVVRERDGRAVMNKLSAAARTMLEPEGTPAESPAAGEAMASD